MTTPKEDPDYEQALQFCEYLEHQVKRWLEGKLESTALRTYLRSVDYGLMCRADLNRRYDKIAEIGCVIDGLNASTVGGDDVSIVRQFALEVWNGTPKSFDSPDEMFPLDPAGLINFSPC